MLKLHDIAKKFAAPGGGTLSILNRFSVKLEAGEFVAVRGPSGCGKSTLLSICGALLRPDAGRVTLEGTDVYALSPNDRARLRARSIGFVFQQFHLIPYLSVRDNVLAPTLATNVEDARSRCAELLQRFGLRDRQTHVPAQLSSGERQRVGLARALLTKPAVVLADEPTGNLDDDNSAVVLDALGEFAKQGGAVLMATHDAAASDRAHRRIDMSAATDADTASCCVADSPLTER